MSKGNGDAIPKADPGVLQRILGVAKSERTEQAAFKRTHDARERARQARVGFMRRLDNYARQNGGEDKYLTGPQERRLLHKERRATGSLGGTWIHKGKNRPTARRERER